MPTPISGPYIARSVAISGQSGLLTFLGLTSTNRAKTVRDAADTLIELGGSYTPTGTYTSLTMVTPVLGTPTSGDLRNCSAATDSVAGVISAADHTTLTGVSTVPATGVAPPFLGVGVRVVAYKSGIDCKTNAVTDVFTVPASRQFVCTNAILHPTVVSGGLAVAIVWKIIESGASLVMTTATAASSTAPALTQVWSQQGAGSVGNTIISNTCAAAAKVQFSITTAWTTSTTVTGELWVYGFYAT